MRRNDLPGTPTGRSLEPREVRDGERGKRFWGKKKRERKEGREVSVMVRDTAAGRGPRHIWHCDCPVHLSEKLYPKPSLSVCHNWEPHEVGHWGN